MLESEDSLTVQDLKDHFGSKKSPKAKRTEPEFQEGENDGIETPIINYDEIEEDDQEPLDPNIDPVAYTWSNSSLLEYTQTFIPKGWEEIFNTMLDEDSGIIQEVSDLLSVEAQQYEIFPPMHLVYHIFERLEPKDIKVILIGQDPYINDGEAMGISFSVPDKIKVPPSLGNIFTELKADGFTVENPKCGDLSAWCDQGVFLINTALTVRAHESGSHKFWLESFTPTLLRWLDRVCQPCVVIMWGNSAQAFDKFFGARHKKIKNVHPSPLSAHKGFFGSKPFSSANKMLKSLRRGQIDWSL
jgi:uracil-DNA glycosylase